MLTLILNIFKDVNIQKKTQTSKELDINTEVSTKVVSNYSRELGLSVPGLKSQSYNEIARQSEGHERLDKYFQSRLEDIDHTDPSSEITEVELLEQKLANRGKLNEKINDVLVREGQTLDSKVGVLKSVQAFLLGRNKSITKSYVENIKTDLEFDKQIDKSNQGSLIDDYANPNLEQPSYMDPED